MIRERSPGRFQVIVYAGLDENGHERRIRRTIVGKKADAKQLERRLHLELGDGHLPAGSITLGDLLDQWLDLARPDLSVSTVHTYESYIKRTIKPELGKLAIVKLTPARLDQFYAKLRATLAPATIRQVHAIIRRALGQAVRWGWIATNPAQATTPPRVPRHEITPPSIEDVVKLLAAAELDDPDFATFLWLAATTGARRGELCALRWCDLDLEAGSMTIAGALAEVGGEVVRKDPKTHQIRRVGLDEATIAVLKRHRARAQGRELVPTELAPVFVVDGAGTPLPPMRATAWFRRLAEAAGVKSRLHDLRHWHVTQLLASGVPVRDAAGRVGHASPMMTLNVYGHATPAIDQAAAELVGRMLVPVGAGRTRTSRGRGKRTVAHRAS